MQAADVASLCWPAILALFGAASLSICPAAESDFRPWRTDHAGESPYTIQPGHFEAEVQAVHYGYSDQEVTAGVVELEFTFLRIPGREVIDRGAMEPWCLRRAC